SAHDIIGTDAVNPTSTIRSAVLMLDFIGEHDAAARIAKAVDDVLATDPVPSRIGELVIERL
ncbi:MAG TPA: isocitrate/isopropylmalate family dehydrogenase, partial [Acidimicrobiales bacterium]